MNALHKRIHTASNIAIILVAMLLGVVAAKNFLFSTSSESQNVESKGVKTGSKLQLADVDWSKSETSLVIVLSST
ncbi:MAG: hypothetical protein WBD22_06050, partial [Pyrinomonadaceae bacterium]